LRNFALPLALLTAIASASPAPVAQAAPAPEEELEAPAAEMRRELALADRQLNDAYKAAMNALNVDGKARMRTVQRQWITRRDRKCAIDPDQGTTDWSPGVLDALACTIEFTNDRTAELAKIAKGN